MNKTSLLCIAIVIFAFGFIYSSGFGKSEQSQTDKLRWSRSERISHQLGLDHAICSHRKTAGQIQTWEDMAKCMNDRNLAFLSQIGFAHIDLFEIFAERRLLVYTELDRKDAQLNRVETATGLLFQQFLAAIEERKAANLLPGTLP